MLGFLKGQALWRCLYLVVCHLGDWAEEDGGTWCSVISSPGRMSVGGWWFDDSLRYIR
jgi:hypothetical protein